MQLSAFTDYSLRVLVYVGLHAGERTSVSQVSEAYGISRHHVVKIVHRLQRSGHLRTFRGRSGGIELGRPAGEVRVGTLVAELESMDLVECFRDGGGGCVLTGSCVLQQALGEARDAFLAALDRYTLDDLLRPDAKLLVALGGGRGAP